MFQGVATSEEELSQRLWAADNDDQGTKQTGRSDLGTGLDNSKRTDGLPADSCGGLRSNSCTDSCTDSCIQVTEYL